MKKLLAKIIVSLFIIIIIADGEASQVEHVDCRNKNSCSECIRTSGCAWCSRVKDEFLQSKSSRISTCDALENITEICEGRSVESPKSTVRVIASRPMKNGRGEDTVQIRPQKVSLKLIPGEEIDVDIEFRRAENYPIDLYYLMDFSSSMSKYKNNLSRLGNKLAETMQNLTTDFQLGFGSFVDKVALPFTSTLPSHLLHPCPRCRSPYSFKNHLSLSKETNRFAAEVEKAEISGNIDTPEGVLDGLMQAMVCQKRLNWREKARHIIVVSTDAPFHLAGDGKLGGVVQPHDGLCHVNEAGEYTHSLVLDYPSVSHINEKARANNMNVIFAVVNKVKHEYHSLSQEIRGSSLGLLDAEENIAELIRAQYEKISTTVRLVHDSKGAISIKFSAKCSPNDEWKNSNECTNLRGMSAAYFKARLLVTDCSKKESYDQTVKIKPEGINETLTVHLQSICDCECSSGKIEFNSEYCSYSGDLVCGECVCHEGKIGSRCECRGNETRSDDSHDNTKCFHNNEVCSGRGECKCGVCQCHERKNDKEKVTGKFCECDNFSCERANGFLCAGHGNCICGECMCDFGWTGSNCDCTLDDADCKNNEGKVCSEKGNCVCGSCQCSNTTDSDGNRYSGKFCQNCMTCVQECHLYNECVECLAHGGGPLKSDNCSGCRNEFQLILVDNIQDMQTNKTGKLCVSADSGGCIFTYIYQFVEDGVLKIWAEKKLLCPKQVNLLAVIAGTAGGTIVIGILSLIGWKIVTDFYDAREFEKFEKERLVARWGKEENPLYKTATRTYENPTYKKDSIQ